MASNDYRQKCFEQRGAECAVCGSEADIEVHHLNGDRSDNRVENLMPLCRQHHVGVHYGDPSLSHLSEQLPERLNENTSRVTVTLDANLNQYLEEWADNNYTTMADAVREHIESALGDSETHDKTAVAKREQKIERLEDEVDYLREALLESVS